MDGVSVASPIDRARLAHYADGLMAAVAVSLPWSTSATGILLVIWLLALVPTLEWPELRRELPTAAGGLPVLLFLLGVAGMAWADVSWHARWNGLDSFFKLLVIPLLFAQFRRSERGLWVLGGYLASCFFLLFVSLVGEFIPPLAAILHEGGDHVLVKNPATQSGEFVTCIFGLLYLAHESFERRRWLWLAGLLAVALAMLADIFYLATGRTALVVIPVLIVLFAVTQLTFRSGAVVIGMMILLAVSAWYSSPYLEKRTFQIWKNLEKYERKNAANSASERIVFAEKSMQFVLGAPVLGHGTGSIHALFEKSAAGKTGPAASATANPHNQTFAVAIQLGLLGALVLWAMWIAHLLLFRGEGLAAWVGLVVVAQNIVGSLFNSHLFDFGQGWIYVIGVGVAGGMTLKARAAKGSGGAAP